MGFSKRHDLRSILILGAGPIVIGQACEFDYSSTQACKALREEGYRTILVNSNPATIMTDPELSDRTYIEPLHWTTIAQVIAQEQPDALLPTMGGQTALNCALDLEREGVLEQYGVEMIGVDAQTINRAEDRQKFRQLMTQIGLKTPVSELAHDMKQAMDILDRIGLPTIIRPSFTLGGAGGGVAYNREEFEHICRQGLQSSPVQEILIEQSILGWKEFELEVVRDPQQSLVVCSVENIDPMGIHTGDSITVAPAQTLTDKEAHNMRNAAFAVLDAVGLKTGGANVQFAVNPEDGDLVVVEMNPRVSRSSALASKATGFPIAKVAAKLAVGYSLYALSNEITQGAISVAFEPALDYVVVKMPRFNFEKFSGCDQQLTTRMKSVGEVMAIGSHIQEALQKAIAGLEIDLCGLDSVFDGSEPLEHVQDRLRYQLSTPHWNRLWYIAEAFRYGMDRQGIYALTKIDPWFLAQIEELVTIEQNLPHSLHDVTAEQMLFMKRKGFTDQRLAQLLSTDEQAIRRRRHAWAIHPVYKRVDTCAAEFPTQTAYMYSTYQQECEAQPTDREKIIILGSGPNRIGQGIEFDYCCVHAAWAVKERYEAIMINCNPETVSTDYDVADRLYFEPLTLECVLEIIAKERPKGVIVHCGGQTPLKLSHALKQAGVCIIGTSSEAIDCSEDRERFQQLVKKLGLLQPLNGTVRCREEGLRIADVLSYPLVVRPSYVLGGRAMEIVHNRSDFCRYMQHIQGISKEHPLLLDHFLDSAVEIDVDAISDGAQVFVAGVLEHIEQAGIHSGDSCCSLPAYRLTESIQQQCREQITYLALELGVIGFVNAQFAVYQDQLYILEVNPRASRTVPFVAKASGLPLAQIATRCMLGVSLVEQGIASMTSDLSIDYGPYFYVKQPVFPFNRFPLLDPALGPEMRSTGEVMGVGQNFGTAFAKSQLAAGMDIPKSGCVFISVCDADKPHIVALTQALIELGFDVMATRGTAHVLEQGGIRCVRVKKVFEGRPHNVDYIKNGAIDFIVNTTEGQQSTEDAYIIARTAVQYAVSYTATLSGAYATVLALQQAKDTGVSCLQDIHPLRSSST